MDAEPGNDSSTWRGGRPVPRVLTIVLGVLALAYIFAGFYVYWLKTGYWTTGEGGTVSNLGGLVWFGPLFGWLALYIIGPVGPLSRLWRMAGTVRLDERGIGWAVDGKSGSAQWSEIAFVDGTTVYGMTSGALLRDSQGRSIAELPADVKRVGPRRRRFFVERRSLFDLILEARPDRYERDFEGLRVRLDPEPT
jgi:hypothetical protein